MIECAGVQPDAAGTTRPRAFDGVGQHEGAETAARERRH
jgi:hypothetical protein